jgi:hypothetical protein
MATTAGLFGIQIQANFTALTGQTGDVLIGYDAVAIGALFHDITMSFNGSPVSSVNETVFNGNSPFQFLGQIQVTNPPPTLTASANLLADTSKIHVTKDIGISCTVGSPCTGQSTISMVDQNFSQVVPEPTSVMLLGTGLAGLGLLSRKRRKS